MFEVRVLAKVIMTSEDILNEVRNTGRLEERAPGFVEDFNCC
jgi:hypothetical protein